MPTNYPNGLDTDTDFPTISPSDTLNAAGKVHSAQHTNLGDAIQAVQAELGNNPSDGAGTTFATVKARLNNMEDRLGTAPVFASDTAPSNPVDGMIWIDTNPSDSDDVIRQAVNQPVNALDEAVQSGDLSAFVPVTTFSEVLAAGAAGTPVYINTTILGTEQLRVRSGFGMYLDTNGKLLRTYGGGTFIETYDLNGNTPGAYINSIVPSHNVYIGGPGEISAQTTAATGNMIGIGGNNLVLDRFTSTLWADGRYVVGVGNNWRVRRVNWDGGAGAEGGSGVGGLRYMGGTGFRCIDSYCYSGDDVWQCVPAGNPSDPFFDVSIDDVIYLGNTGRSYTARFMVCGLQANIDDGQTNPTRMHGSIGANVGVKYINNNGFSGGTAIACQNKSSDGVIKNIEFIRCCVDGSLTIFDGDHVDEGNNPIAKVGQGGAFFVNGVTGWVENITYTDTQVINHHEVGFDTGPTGNFIRDITFVGGRMERSRRPSLANDPIAKILGTRVSFLQTVFNRRGSNAAIATDGGTSTVLNPTIVSTTGVSACDDVLP